MNGSDINAVIDDLKTGQFKIDEHADMRMGQRTVLAEDIIRVGQTVCLARIQRSGRIEVVGEDLDGETLRVICEYDGETLIITVIGT